MLFLKLLHHAIMKKVIICILCLLPLGVWANVHTLDRKRPEALVVGRIIENFTFNFNAGIFQGLCDIKVESVDYAIGVIEQERQAIKAGDTIRQLWYDQLDFNDTLTTGQAYTFYLSIEQYGLASDTSSSFLGNGMLLAIKDPAAFERNRSISVKRGKTVITQTYYTANKQLATKSKQVNSTPLRTVVIYSNWDEKGKLLTKRKEISFSGYAGITRRIVWIYVSNGKRCLKRSVINF